MSITSSPEGIGISIRFFRQELALLQSRPRHRIQLGMRRSFPAPLIFIFSHGFQFLDVGKFIKLPRTDDDRHSGIHTYPSRRVLKLLIINFLFEITHVSTVDAD
jgi:hypothetical protein